jgi:hypothetical protein
MKFCKISVDMKERALALLQGGWNIEESAETLNICAEASTAGNINMIT